MHNLKSWGVRSGFLYATYLNQNVNNLHIYQSTE